MSIKSFDELSSKVERDLKKEDIVRLSISPTERLAVTLRYVICLFLLLFFLIEKQIAVWLHVLLENHLKKLVFLYKIETKF